MVETRHELPFTGITDVASRKGAGDSTISTSTMSISPSGHALARNISAHWFAPVPQVEGEPDSSSSGNTDHRPKA